MWQATDGIGPTLYVKVHARPYLFERHMKALRDWAPHLPCATPEVLYTNDERLLMVFAELPGVPLDAAELSPDTELAVYETAGRVARTFHAIRSAEDVVDLEPVAARMARFLASARCALSPALVDWLTGILPETAIFDGERPVPCHRDYSPRNWLVRETPTGVSWSLIDFERARFDLKYADFQRMWPDWWRERPDRRSAFFSGYGRELTREEEQRLRFTVLINCLGTIPWAVENDDPAFGAWALETVEWIRRQW